MLRKKKGQVEWLEFELLQEYPEVVHGVFLRHGGVSKPPYDSLNAGTKDDPQAISQNRRRMYDILGVPHIMQPNDCHGGQVEPVFAANERPTVDCDGLMTQLCNLGLMITHADCQAAIFYDPTCKVLANVHCGWRGNVHNIYANTVHALQKQFVVNPKNLRVCISPSLGPNAAEFIHYRKELPESFWSFQVKPTYFDLWAISRHQLERVGVPKAQIEVASLCTFENRADFFSYRRDKVTGRHATIAFLKK